MMSCKFIMRRIILQSCFTRSLFSQPQLKANRQTNTTLLISLPSPLMRSQHPLPRIREKEEVFSEHFFLFYSFVQGTYIGHQKCFAFSVTHHAGFSMCGERGWDGGCNTHAPQPSFCAHLPFSLLLIASCFRPPPTFVP